MTVYLDIIFIENILMNFIILFATGIALKVNMKQLKLISSSTIGAIYAIITYLKILPILTNFFMKILLSIVIIYLAFTPKNVKQLLKQLLMFYLVSFIFGGCAIALLYFVKPQNVLMRGGVFVGEYPIKIALLSGIVGFIIIQISFKFIKNKINQKNMFCKLKICMKNKTIEIKALIDSGNFLQDPISHIPVAVVEKEKLYNIFPSEILDNIEKIKTGGDNQYENQIENDYLSRFRVVPFSSLGKQNGLLLGIKVDKIYVINSEEEQIESNAIIAIYEKSLTKNGTYSALVGLDILEGRDVSELITNN